MSNTELASAALETTRRRRPKIKILALQLGLLASILGLWQFAYSHTLVRRIVLPSPAQVWDAAAELQRNGLIWENLKATLSAMAIAFVLASVVGTLVGLWLALTPLLERVVAPFLHAMNSAPRIAFAPIFIIAFGISTSAKVALAFSIVVFLMISATRSGVHAADPDVERLLVVMGASRSQVFWKLLLPVAVPAIFAGLRLALIYSLLGVVTSEMIASKSGMGQIIARYSATFELPYVYATIFILVIVGWVMNGLAGWAERRLLWWKPPTGKGALDASG